ncbi:hypothetical protein Tco_0444534 [Tanacetum coccineum]
MLRQLSEEHCYARCTREWQSGTLKLYIKPRTPQFHHRHRKPTNAYLFSTGWGKQKESAFHTKDYPSLKDGYNFYTWTYVGSTAVESFNGKKICLLIIVDDYSREYDLANFLRRPKTRHRRSPPLTFHSKLKLPELKSRPNQRNQRCLADSDMEFESIAVEELHQFDRLDVWELVDRPLCKNVIKT